MLIALALRLICYFAVNRKNFDFSDVFHYIHLAENISTGKGFSISRELAVDYVKSSELFSKITGIESQDLLEYEKYYYGIVPYDKPNTFWDPLLPYAMSFFLSLGDNNFILFNILGCIVGVMSCWLVYRLGVLILSPGAGLLGALIMALEFNSIFYSSLLLTENLAIFLLLLAILLMYKAADGAKPGGLIFLGIVLGLAYLARSNLLIFLPIAVVFLFLKYVKSNRYKLAYVLLGFIIAGSPWWSRNMIKTGHPGFLPSKGSFNLWKSFADLGCLAEDMGLHLRSNPDKIRALVEGSVNYPEAMNPSVAEGETEYDRAQSLRKHAIKFIFANPVLSIKRYFKHLVEFYNPWPRFGTKPEKMFLASIFSLIIILGVLGFIASIKEGKSVYPLIVFIIAFTLIGGLFRLGFRFRMPIMPVFMLTAGYFLSIMSRLKFFKRIFTHDAGNGQQRGKNKFS